MITKAVQAAARIIDEAAMDAPNDNPGAYETATTEAYDIVEAVRPIIEAELRQDIAQQIRDEIIKTEDSGYQQGFADGLENAAQLTENPPTKPTTTQPKKPRKP